MNANFVSSLSFETLLDVVAGPMTFYGSVIFCIPLVLFYVNKSKAFVESQFRLPQVIDCAVPAVVFGLAFGRLGCFFNGDDYGLPLPFSSTAAGVPWWASIHSGPGHLPRYPVQLQESLASFLIWFLAMVCTFQFYFRKRLKFAFPGFIGLVAASASLLNRFGNEFFRGDERGSFLASSLSFSQGCVIVLLTMVLIYGFKLNKISKGMKSE